METKSKLRLPSEIYYVQINTQGKEEEISALC